MGWDRALATWFQARTPAWKMRLVWTMQICACLAHQPPVIGRCHAETLREGMGHMTLIREAAAGGDHGAGLKGGDQHLAGRIKAQAPHIFDGAAPLMTPEH